MQEKKVRICFFVIKIIMLQSCAVLKSEYDKLCFKNPHPNVASETITFCEVYRNTCKALLTVIYHYILINFIVISD